MNTHDEPESAMSRVPSQGDVEQSTDPASDTVVDLTTVGYRPTQRPPVAVLCVMDDNQEAAEKLRIRAERFVIGRTEGEFVLPHDAQVSSRHAEIRRELEEGDDDAEAAWVWYLKDLGSTNGTFVKLARARLKPGNEFFVGSSRLRFDEKTVGEASVATIVEVTTEGDGAEHQLVGDEHWIGRDARQSWLSLDDDASVSGRHARVFRDQRGRWSIEDGNSLNGTWLRIDELRLSSGSEFETGEQRFRVLFN